MKFKIIQSDAFSAFLSMGSEVMHAFCTSVPFWKQRDYLVPGAFGQEELRDDWAANITRDLREVRRTLRDDGTGFVVVGETWTAKPTGDLKTSEVSLQAPFLAEHLRRDGWWIKSLVVIEYTNPAPTSAHNRPIQAHQYGILVSKKSTGYYWDYITSRERGVGHERLSRAIWSGKTEKAYTNEAVAPGFKHSSIYPSWVVDRFLSAAICEAGVCSVCGSPRIPVICKAKGGSTGESWLAHGDDLVKGNAKTTSSKGYVPATIEDWKAGCSCDALAAPPLVGDPYTGTSTTGVVALRRGCSFIGVDLDRVCVRLSEARLAEVLKEDMMFNSDKDARSQSKMFRGES